MVKNIFFIGPASVGKSTVGKLLAQKVGYNFIDIDLEFIKRIGAIYDYINTKGYVDYCEANSSLVDKLLEDFPANTVFATPSGFLAHEECPHLVAKHSEKIKAGISVLLFPSSDPLEVVNLIVERQLARWPYLTPECERQKFLDRFEKYKNYGDIKIFSLESPEVIADEVCARLGWVKI